MEKRYYSASDYYKKIFGKKMYKLSLSIADTCPNRDGTKGTGGCIFCSECGSGDFAAERAICVDEQIEKALEKVKSKNKGGGYIAYFQSFTSTYLPIEKLRNALFAAANNDKIEMICVATRADCLGDDVLSVLKEVSKIIPLSVELGLQSAHEKTAKLINRCCETEEFSAAISALKAIGVPVVLHLIIGLPFESREDILQSIDFVNKSGAAGVKLQLLHVIKGTRLCKMYENGEFETLTAEQYFEILADAVNALSKDIVIHRLTGDGDKKTLVAPLWSADKKRVLNDMNKFFETHDVRQGKNFKGSSV